MKIDEAIFDNWTGNAVIFGCIKVFLPEEGERVAKEHSQLLFRHSSTDFETDFEFRSVAAVGALPNGLYNVDKADLCVGLNAPMFYEIIAAPSATGKIRIEQNRSGVLSINNKEHYSVTAFEMSQRLTEDGLLFNIDGELAPANAEIGIAKASPDDRRFSIFGTIPWATMKVQGIRISDRRHQFVQPEYLNSTGLKANHTKTVALTDLRLGAAFQAPLVPGRLDVHGAGQRYGAAVENMVFASFGPNGLGIGDVQQAFLLENGFCDLRDSNYRFFFRGITLPFIENMVQAKSPASLSISGDGLGGLHTYVALGEEPFSTENWAPQDFDRLDFTAELDESGLRLSISGKLRGFSPQVLKRYEHIKHPKQLARLQPREDFSVEALLPWVLLLVRGSTLRTTHHIPKTVTA